jgi:nicotinic acid mononucleotide adenylyltransferase
MIRTVLLVGVALASSQGTALQPERTAVVVKAWSSTAGPYGAWWALEIGADGAASVTRWRGADEAGQERHFTVAPKDRSAIMKAVEDAKFFDLPEYLGPSAVPLHGPENALQIESDGRVRRVTLHDPSTERGAEVERFKRAWNAVVKLSSLKPPL